MSTVAKLSYAGLRNKSKSKDMEQSDRPVEPKSNELFSHMNQDNLKYIQNQIKQKNKKNSRQAAKDEPVHLKSYPELIEEKDSKYEETEREPDEASINQQYNVIKTQGENRRAHQPGMKNRRSADDENLRLTFYDLLSQAKSKRISSLEGQFEEQKTSAQKQGNFLNFLQLYISDLNQSSIMQKKALQTKENKQHELQNRDILIRAVQQEKQKNLLLAKELSRHRELQTQNTLRIQKMEGAIQILVQELEIIRKEMRYEAQKPQPHQQSMKMNIRAENSRISLQSKNSQRGTIESRMGRKNKYQAEQISQLEKQLKFFEETGQFRKSE